MSSSSVLMHECESVIDIHPLINQVLFPLYRLLGDARPHVEAGVS